MAQHTRHSSTHTRNAGAQPTRRTDSRSASRVSPLIPLLGILAGLAIAAIVFVRLGDAFTQGTPFFGDSGERVEVVEPEYVEPQEMDVLMIGDILMHQGVWESGMKSDGTYDYTHFWAHMADDLAECELKMLDQETILGGTELGISGYPIFNSPQEVGDSEVAVGFNCILQATNHSMDKGDEGVRRCVSFWREKHPDVMLCGVVMPGEEVAADLGPQYYEENGIKVAVLNYTEMLNGIPDPSDAVAEIDEAQMQKDIATAEANADITIVCPHWGDEDENYPAERQRELAAKMCDWGVDVVFGNHPHVMQPVEVVKNDAGHEMVVYWSVGNFVSTQITSRNMIGGIARVHITKEDGAPAYVDRYSFTPTVTHRGFGTDMTNYKLADYTDDMVDSNWWHGVEEKPTPAWAKAYCKEILGDAFNEETCILEGTMYAGGAPAGSATISAAAGADAQATEVDQAA